MEIEYPHTGEQLRLFPQRGVKGEKGPQLAELAALTPSSSLSAAISSFQHHMQRQTFTENTIKAFMADLRLLGKFVGISTPISQIGNRQLNDFLTWMLEYRGVACSPKTYSRRVTTLKVFFAWLHESGLKVQDPAAAIPHHHAAAPLPKILYNDQVDRLLQATREWMEGEKPDPRPHLLVTLLLDTGIKKSECIRITLTDIDRSNPKVPVLYIRYQNPRHQHKQRKLALSPDLIVPLDRYLAAYRPQQNLFECTARNLEYILDEAAQRAGLTNGVSFEMLRWTCAVRDFANDMRSDQLRDKLGLSPVTWYETADKLKKLAGPAL